MRHLTLILGTLLLLVSCGGDPRSEEDRVFEDVVARFLEGYLSMHPEEASAMGDRRFDARMNDYSREGIAAAMAYYERYRDTLRAIRVENLSPAHMIDYGILQHALESRIFDVAELREWEWNPLTYNIGDAVYTLMTSDTAPLEERMRAVASRLRGIPTVLAAARRNLSEPPVLHTQTAILQNEGNIKLLTVALDGFLGVLPPSLKDSVLAARDAAVAELYRYGTWLRVELLPRATGDFRLGAELYRKKFALRLDTQMAPEELRREAERLLERTTENMYHLAVTLYDRYFPGNHMPDDRREVIRVVLERLAEDHPNDSTIVPQARRDLALAEQFVRGKQLLTVPTERLDVIVMPEFQRGVAVAYCDTPGPLEAGGKTFFAIAPTPQSWTAERKSSFYREYNDYMLKNLTTHEAMPGHYVQQAAANAAGSPTMIRGIFPSSVFIEGWATYAEQLMADAGFGGPEVKLQQMKMYLRLLINAIIDQGIHAGAMREAEAMKRMMVDGFQEEGEAAGKWRRACLTSVQLSTYCYGNLSVLALRQRYEAKAGSSFDLKSFHDTLLSYGSISPKFHPMLMKLPAQGETVAQR